MGFVDGSSEAEPLIALRKDKIADFLDNMPYESVANEENRPELVIVNTNLSTVTRHREKTYPELLALVFSTRNQVHLRLMSSLTCSTSLIASPSSSCLIVSLVTSETLTFPVIVDRVPKSVPRPCRLDLTKNVRLAVRGHLVS